MAFLSHQFSLPYVKWIFPTAPVRPITLNGGMSSTGWFDLGVIEKLMKGDKDEVGIRSSVEYVDGLIQKELDSGIPENRIIIGGFSQGGHIAVKHMLNSRHALPACVVLSSWLEDIPDQASENAKKCRFWIGHGANDPLIPVQLSSIAEQVLRNKGCEKVQRTVYPGTPHSLAPQELSDVEDFLKEVIPEESKPPPTQEQIEDMSIKELRAYLSSKHISTTGFLEKKEFVEAAKRSL